MDAQVVNIFDPLFRKLKKDLANGPLDVGYLCSKYGIEFFLRLLEMTDDFVIIGEGAASDKFVELRKTKIEDNGTK